MTLSTPLFLLSFLIVSFSACKGQSAGSTTTDEALIPDQSVVIDSVLPTDYSPGWHLPGQKVLLTGVVYQQDGKTPVPGVLIYYYQTDTGGRYLHKSEEKRSMPPNQLGQTHGYIRGWVKTDKDGKYFIYTVRPGAYPTADFPAHVHLTIKEPNSFPEYYIDDIVFDDDKLLTSAYRKKMENRCGSGVVRLVRKDTLFIGERNIYLGLNIPDYPTAGKVATENSGINVGEDIMSFAPFHAWGPDRGSRACPVCKYGRYHGILYFVGNFPNWAEIKKWLRFLETESKKRGRYLKAYFVYGNEEGFSKQAREKQLEKLGEELKLQHMALSFVPSFADTECEINLIKINPEMENTFILYKRSNVIGRYTNLKPTQENFNKLISRFDETINEYFKM